MIDRAQPHLGRHFGRRGWYVWVHVRRREHHAKYRHGAGEAINLDHCQRGWTYFEWQFLGPHLRPQTVIVEDLIVVSLNLSRG